MKDDLFERLFIVAILLFLATLVNAVVDTARIAHETKPVPKPAVEKVHLPSKCRALYDSGTDEWKNCMQVEYE